MDEEQPNENGQFIEESEIGLDFEDFKRRFNNL
jgi:hypothetical protein